MDRDGGREEEQSNFIFCLSCDFRIKFEMLRPTLFPLNLMTSPGQGAKAL